MNYEIINARKRELNLNNAQIAEQSGVTLSTIDKITSGANQNPKLDTLLAIADVLGLTLDDFKDGATPSIERVAPAPSPEAIEFYNMYDRLDTHGKQMVDTVLRLEYERCHPKDEFVEEYIRSIIQERLRSTQGNQQSG